MTHTKDEALKLAKSWFEANTYGDEAVEVYQAIEQALAEPVQPVAHCEQGPNFCKQCANQQAEDCAAILYRDHNENPWVHVIQKDLPSGTKLIAVTKGQP
jgi:hypothetical protein